MSQAIAVDGTKYTVAGTIKNRVDEKGIPGLHVLVFDKDMVTKDDFLDTTITDANGRFIATFDLDSFNDLLLDRRPDLYFIVSQGDTELLNTRDAAIKNADETTDPITLWLNEFDSDAPGAGNVPAEGWKGGFAESNPAFAYPTPDLSSLGELKDNLANIDLLQRQQKVLWPEFSWETDPGDPDSRCYTMFAPDISRLGYTDEGRVYSIICPQQGSCNPKIGCMNVEVTVTGNRGWVKEEDKTLYADMSVVGKIWFSPSSRKTGIIRRLWSKFADSDRPFPSDKERAIEIITYLPGGRPETSFPLKFGETPPSEFPIPEFARHEEEAWNVAHLSVEIGPIKKTGDDMVDEFNQMILNIFNKTSGNMLKDGNTLSWNVWFIAPQQVDVQEWKNHAEKWRKSLDADHGSPMGGGTEPRYFNGDPFTGTSSRSLLEEEESEEEMLEAFEAKYF